MAYRALLATLALMGSSLASAATLSPVATGGISSSFPTDAIFSLDPTCGAARPGEPELSGGTIGYTGSNILTETRLNHEYRYPAGRGNTRLSLSFGAEFEVGLDAIVCVLGYRGDGTITARDFQLEDAVFLGQAVFAFNTDDNLPLDVSDVLDLGGPFFGLQFAVPNFADVAVTLTDVELTAERIREVPEPAALGLFGAGLLLLAAGHRQRR